MRVRLGLALPPPFTLVPRIIVQSAAGAVLRSVTLLVVPQFVSLLEKDYARWLDGTRDVSVGVGSLMVETKVLSAVEDQDGSVVEEGAPTQPDTRTQE